MTWLVAAALGADGVLIPTAPPVNVHTSSEDRDYIGVGYLRFGVTLPQAAEPGFTLTENDEDRMYFGDVRFTADTVGIAWGKFRAKKSDEMAVMFGPVRGSMVTGDFFHNDVEFDPDHRRGGGVAVWRYAFARRAFGGDRLFLDWAITNNVGVYYIQGNTRIESEETPFGYEYPYVTDYNEGSFGFAYRPVITLQPTLPIGRVLSLIPFGGGSAFAFGAINSWTVQEWTDPVYGEDCESGCPDTLATGGAFVDYFGGFDIDIHFTKKDSLSLSSLFRPPSDPGDSPVSEVYVIYGRGLDLGRKRRAAQ